MGIRSPIFWPRLYLIILQIKVDIVFFEFINQLIFKDKSQVSINNSLISRSKLTASDCYQPCLNNIYYSEVSKNSVSQFPSQSISKQDVGSNYQTESRKNNISGIDRQLEMSNVGRGSQDNSFCLSGTEGTIMQIIDSDHQKYSQKGFNLNKKSKTQSVLGEDFSKEMYAKRSYNTSSEIKQRESTRILYSGKTIEKSSDRYNLDYLNGFNNNFSPYSGKKMHSVSYINNEDSKKKSIYKDGTIKQALPTLINKENMNPNLAESSKLNNQSMFEI